MAEWLAELAKLIKEKTRDVCYFETVTGGQHLTEILNK